MGACHASSKMKNERNILHYAFFKKKKLILKITEIFASKTWVFKFRLYHKHLYGL